MKFFQRICWGSLGLSLVVTSIGCFKPTGSETTEPKVQTRKTIGKTTQNVLELKAATEAGGVPASMAVTSSAIGVAADAYRTSVGTMAVLAVEQRMQMHQAQFHNFVIRNPKGEYATGDRREDHMCHRRIQ